MLNRNYIALIPLRGGSKSIPKKNIKSIAGYPLCYYAIKSAVDSNIFSKIIISTDSYEIAGICFHYFGDEIHISMRPAELAQDTSSTESVMLHESQHHEYDVMCLIQATSPLTSPIDFINAKVQFEKEEADSLVTGVRSKRFFWDTKNHGAINYNPLNRPRRQDFEGWIMENGAFYFTTKEVLTTSQCRLGGKISIFEMPEETSIEIDEHYDWLAIEQILLSKRKTSSKDLEERIKHLKLVITDVDGTLTDAGMYYNNEGDFLKKFNTRDAKGLELIRDELGLEVVIVTREKTDIVVKRAEKLKLEAHIGILDKKSFLEAYLIDKKLKWSEVAFFGDDLTDLQCMQLVGFAGCPNNAEDAIQKVSHFVASKDGGMGAVREICNYMLSIHS